MAQHPTIKCLTSSGPLTSGEFARRLVQKHGSPNLSAARQAIRRAKQNGTIRSTEPVRFNRDYLYYLDRHRPARYVRAVQKNLESTPGMFRVFKCLLANHGYITRGQIEKASGSLPDDALRFNTTRPGTSLVIERLLSLGLVEECPPIPGAYIIGDEFRGRVLPYAKFRRAIDLDYAVLNGFEDWLKRCLMLSWDAHEVRSDTTNAINFNRTAWDVAGPTMLGPFTRSKDVRKGKTKSAFIMGETLAYRQFSINDAEGVVERTKSVALTNTTTSFFPYVVARGYSKEAFTRLKSTGVVPLTLGDLYGDRAEELLRLYSDMMNRPGDSSLDDLGRSLELADAVELDDGLLGNIRGDLFELLISNALKGQGYDTSMQKPLIVVSDGTELEVDVVAVKSRMECLIIECKGRRGDIAEDPIEVEKHFRDRCRAASDTFGWDVVEKYNSVEAIFITSGTFGEDCIDVLENNRKSHGITTSGIDRDGLKEFLDRSGEPRLWELVERYF